MARSIAFYDTTYQLSIWNSWLHYNTQKPGDAFPQPNLEFSQQAIRRGDGQLVTLQQLLNIKSDAGYHHCVWTMYDEPIIDQVCVDALPNFKVGYNRPGTLDQGNVSPDQWTILETFKVNTMAARYDVTTCANVLAPNTVSGMKWFDHTKTNTNGNQYSAPSKNAWNFGIPKTPDDYLTMIEQVTPGVKQSVLDNLVRRCQQIDSSVTAADVSLLLKSQPLPLGGKQFLFVSNGKLVLDSKPPAWSVLGTRADGSPLSFGNSYSVQDTYNNTQDMLGTTADAKLGDGNFYIPFAKSPPSTCSDKAIWRASTGYNNLLGELSFTNTCQGGGQFCQPN